MTYNPNKPFAPGDKVLVSATITEINDDDPHDPQVIVWFNGQPHSTTVMNLQHDKSKQPVTRSSWGDIKKPEFPVTVPTPVQTFNFNATDFDDPADLVVDVSPQFRTEAEESDVEALIDLVETPTDEPPAERGGRTAPRTQGMIFDGRRGLPKAPRHGRLFSVSNDTDEE